MAWINFNDNAADAITGDRIVVGERVFDTEKPNVLDPYGNHSRTRLVKEETIVWLAEQAGYTVSRNDGDSGSDRVDEGVTESAPELEREDAGVGAGENPAGAVEAGGDSAPKRRSSRASKGK